MTMQKKLPLTPENYTAITPWLISPSSEKLIEFMKSAFGAEEIPNSRITNDEGKIIHVVVSIDKAMVQLFDSHADWAPTPAFLNLYVEDVEKTLNKAIELGAMSVTKITRMWFGEKVCRILDPFGNLWWLNERVEEVDLTDAAEVNKRSSAPKAIENVAYIQESLDYAMKSQKEFFEAKS